MIKSLDREISMKKYDVIIIGGSYAGLSAAMALGRSLKHTLIIDAGKPCNRQTPHSHNFLTQDGNTPKMISSLAKDQVSAYETVHFHDGIAQSGVKKENGYEIVTKSGDIFIGKKLIFATGIKDEIPNITGFAECWGISVIHCPYCHGYEYKGKKTGIFANGDKAFHLASLVSNLTDELMILTNGNHAFDSEQIEKLNHHKIKIEESKLVEIDHENGILNKITLDTGNNLELEAMYAHVQFSQHSAIPESLDCKLSENGYIETDQFQKTTVPDIFACGDNSTMMRSIASAVSSGNLAGAMVNMELTNENF